MRIVAYIGDRSLYNEPSAALCDLLSAEAVIAAVLLVAVVIGLFIAVIIPMASKTQEAGDAGANRIENIFGEEDE